MIRWSATVSLAVLTAITPALAAEQKAHEHGRAELEVAVDGSTLLITFESPLDNLVGFEHQPKTQAQKDAIAKMEASLQAFDTLFKPSPAAGCKVTDTRVTPPFAAGGEGHAEARVEYTLSCSDPKALDRLEVNVFDRFRGTHGVDAQTATATGQGSAKLTKSKRVLSLAAKK